MLVCILALASTFSSAPAVAGGEAFQKADALFKEGRALMKKGDYRAACPLLAESQRLDPAAGTLINLGDCSDQLGRVADALDAYRNAVELLSADDPRRGPVAEQIRALERRVPTLRLRFLRPAPPGLRVTLNGIVLDPKAWGTARPSNAGTHQLVFTVPGREPKQRRVVLAEAERRELVVELEDERAPVPHESTPARDQRTSTDPVPWIIGGAGVASLAASGVLFLLHRSETRELERDCIDRVCPSSSDGTIARANLFGTASWVSLAGGVAGVGVAAVWLGTKGNEGPAAAARRRVELGASATRGGGAAFARARF
ncbi:MAG: hypothetical protein HYZ29_21885 [Myxococcales bacterium]|nr:hypothetical protein [Myxococcales bacterium]